MLIDYSNYMKGVIIFAHSAAEMIHLENFFFYTIDFILNSQKILKLHFEVVVIILGWKMVHLALLTKTGNSFTISIKLIP